MSLTFEPHASKSFSDLWTGFAAAGAGRYALRAKLLTSAPIVSSPVSLGVLPGAGFDLNRPPLRPEEFGAAEGVVYLNHAAAGLLPRRTRDTLVALADGQMERGVLGFLSVEMHLERYREHVAQFIGASGDEISFLRNTGDGANVVARGLDWQPGDEIVLCTNEFGANAMPWLALRESGAVIRFIDAPAERMTPELLAARMSPRTRVVALSWVSFADGYRHDLAALSAVVHAGGALFCVDAIQALGAFPLDVKREGIDALYAGGANGCWPCPASGSLMSPRRCASVCARAGAAGATLPTSGIFSTTTKPWRRTARASKVGRSTIWASPRSTPRSP